MAEAVVHSLEVVEVGQHQRKRTAEALDAPELPGELVLTLPAVRQAGEPVDTRLPLDDPV